MKNKFIIIIFKFILSLFIVCLFKFKNNVNIDKSEIKTLKSNMISILLETENGSGIYELSKSSKWPDKGFVFNKEMSYCNNGSQIVYNDENNSVSVKINKTDKCQIYF